jgi:hypothetical protein
MEKKVEGIYDGFKELGTAKWSFLASSTYLQCLEPLSSFLSFAACPLCHLVLRWYRYNLVLLITKKKVPVFLGSSFAFIGAILGAAGTLGMPYAKGGIVAAGLTYVILVLFAVFGAKRIMRLFPPVVTGPIIMLIGLWTVLLRV